MRESRCLCILIEMGMSGDSISTPDSLGICCLECHVGENQIVFKIFFKSFPETIFSELYTYNRGTACLMWEFIRVGWTVKKMPATAKPRIRTRQLQSQLHTRGWHKLDHWSVAPISVTVALTTENKGWRYSQVLTCIACFVRRRPRNQNAQVAIFFSKRKKR